MKAKSLQDLGAIRKQVNDAALAAAAAKEARKEAERRAEAERNLFTRLHPKSARFMRRLCCASNQRSGKNWLSNVCANLQAHPSRPSLGPCMPPIGRAL